MTHPISKLSFLFLLSPGLASAHTGTGDIAGFMQGFSHPIAGGDHFLAMVAVGFWAAQIGGRALWAVPCTFVVLMIGGGVLGISEVPVPLVEEGIAVSVLILGVLIAGGFQAPLVYSALIVGFFAVFHGYAHVAEMPAAFGSGSYTVGFALATAMLHATGMALGTSLRKTNLQTLKRFSGGAIALGGIYFAIS